MAISRFRIVPVLAAGAVLVLSLACQRPGLQELRREPLFSLSFGKMDDQIDLFQPDGEPVTHKNRIFMSDGLFYVANGNSDKIMVFSSYGDLIFLLYNPRTNPPPSLPAATVGDDSASTRSSMSFLFQDIGEIAVSNDKTMYVEDDVLGGKGIKDEKTGAFLQRVILRFDRRGRPDGYIGREGVGGTPFPFIQGLFVTGRDQLVVVTILPNNAREAFWYSKEGALLHDVVMDPARLPAEKDSIASLVDVVPDMQSLNLYLTVYYYRQTVDSKTNTQSSIENFASRIYRLSAETGEYGSSIELPANPKRKEKVGFKTIEIASPPSQLIGVSDGGFYYLLSLTDTNLYTLTILDASGRVRERRYMVIEDSELTYRDLRLAGNGMIYGLLCDRTKAYVSRWRSDLLLKGE
jgi:hypothetical protein